MAKDFSNIPAGFGPCYPDSLTVIGGNGLIEIERAVGAPTSTPSGTDPIEYINEATGDLYTWNGTNWVIKAAGGTYTFQNGLTETGNVAKLGGVLTQATTIDGVSNTYGLTLSNLLNFNLTANSSLQTINGPFILRSTGTGTTFLGSNQTVTLSGDTGILLDTPGVMAATVLAGQFLKAIDTSGTVEFAELPAAGTGAGAPGGAPTGGASNIYRQTDGTIWVWTGASWFAQKDTNTNTTYGAANGLSLNGGNFELGGSLTGATTITGGANDFSLTGIGNLIFEGSEVRVKTPNVTGASALAGQFTKLVNATTGEVEYSELPAAQTGAAAPSGTPTGGASNVYRQTDGTIWVWTGSAWLAQKDTFYTPSNGLSLNGSQIELGGPLTSNTVITGNFNGFNISNVGQFDLTSFTNANITGTNGITLIGAVATLSANVELRLKTAKVNAVTATLNHFAKLIDAATGETEFAAVTETDLNERTAQIQPLASDAELTDGTSFTWIVPEAFSGRNFHRGGFHIFNTTTSAGTPVLTMTATNEAGNDIFTTSNEPSMALGARSAYSSTIDTAEDLLTTGDRITFLINISGDAFTTPPEGWVIELIAKTP